MPITTPEKATSRIGFVSLIFRVIRVIPAGTKRIKFENTIFKALEIFTPE